MTRFRFIVCKGEVEEVVNSGVYRDNSSFFPKLSVASIMGLISNSKCPFCSSFKPNCRQIIFCQSSNDLWKLVWSLIDLVLGPNVARSKDRIF